MPRLTSSTLRAEQTPSRATSGTTPMPPAGSTSPTRASDDARRRRRNDEPQMQARKTHEQQHRMLERKLDVPDGRRTDAALGETGQNSARAIRRGGRQSLFPVSRGALNQESREHN